MNNYIICCESTADLSDAHFQERGISYACFTFQMDGSEYADDYGKSMPLSVFYDRMRAGSVSTTSQVSVTAYETLWKPHLEAGKDILHITLSSGISGTFNSASVAAEELRETFPERRIEVIDSFNASSGYGLLVDLAADKRDAGAVFEEACAYVREMRDCVNAWFFTSDLTYLCRGGRVSKTAFVLGTALKVCPLLRISREGKLLPAAKCRGKKRVIDACAERMLALADGGAAYDGPCYISQSECMEDVDALIAALESRMPKLRGKVRVYEIGTVIGSHTGPGTAALFFVGAPKEP